MPPEFPSISELTESYETADRFTREVARFRSAVAVRANNELRYAGHHLLQALDGQEQIFAVVNAVVVVLGDALWRSRFGVGSRHRGAGRGDRSRAR